MIAEFSIVPVGKGVSIGRYVAECMKIVRDSGLDHELTPMGTILQGDHDRVMATISLCHKRVASMSDRVVTYIKIDDRRDERPMRKKVESVMEKL
ncbi:MAG: MTH1187 family thiamine-binding protein [Euryarchaeota archaeon]|nr:MTH1187 family thiamine-binding protein [Euryarchaeota archaeon]